MSSATIIRAFKAQPSQMISEATKLANSSAYAVKKFFYNLVTLGCGKAIQEARATRREKEIANMAKDVLQILPTKHSELTDTSHKELHTNMKEKYQITLEDNKLCLYTGTVPHSWFGSGNSTFKKDPASKVVLKTISSDKDLKQLRKDLADATYETLPKNSKEYLDQQLNFAKTQKGNLKQETITEKTNIDFSGNGGKFNPAWENHLKDITAQNYQIEKTSTKETGGVFKILNKNNPTQHILIVAKAQSNRADKKMIDQQISEFFKQNPASTLDDFLNQSVAVNDSNRYNVLKSPATFKSDDMSDLYPLFEHYLDNY